LRSARADGAPPAELADQRRLSRGMRALLWVAAVLVFLAGIQLFLFPERTERFFAWTINPPLTAAFLGAAYWSSVAFEARAALTRTWAEARIAVPTVFVFTTLTLVVTLVHIDAFHLESTHQMGTRAVTWAWIAIYVVVPVVLAVLWFAQARQPGGDPPRDSPLPRWLTTLVAVQALVLLPLGAYLLLAPEDASALWPWDLTALTARATGAWVLSLGVAAAHAVIERDVGRLQPAAVAYLTFGVLQAIALLRYPDTPDWADPAAIAYAAFLASAVIAGGATLWLHQRREPPASASG
jgi:hypothetical protein